MTTDKNNSPVTAPMWWDGGDRAITAREKATIEEHGPSSFSIPLVQATALQPAGLAGQQGVAFVTDAMVDAACKILHHGYDHESRKAYREACQKAARQALEAALATTGTQHVGEVESVDDDWRLRGYAYASKQATTCAGCGKHKHTPLRIDAMGGYVCLTCIDQKLGSLLDEFGYLPAQDGELQGDALYIEWLKERISSIYSTVSLGHQTGPYAYAGEDFSRYLTEAASDCRKIMRVLSALAAQPSPAGQGAVPCATSASHALRVAYRHLDMVSMRVSHCKDASIIESAMKDVDTFDLNAAISALAARQPGAQEPVGFQIMRRSADDTCFNGRWDNPPSGFHDDREYYVSRPGTYRIRDIYAALPAQGIDLGQFRPFVQAERTHLSGRIERCDAIGSSDRLEALQAKACECDRLLALIDQHDAAPGVGND